MKARRKAKAAPDAPAEVAHEAVLVERPKQNATARHRDQEEALGGIKNKIFGDSMRVVEDYLRARDVNPKCAAEPTQDPAFWKMALEFGGDEEETHKVYRLASAGWLPSADAPGFVKVAANMAVGIMKANAAEKGGTKVLNVGRIMIGAESLPVFEEREVGSD